MTVERINPPSLAEPSGFSHAVTTTGSRLVFLAGQTAIDRSGTIVGDGLVGQFEQALGNLLTALEAAGGTPAHLARVTIYATDPVAYRANAREIGAVWRRLVGSQYPAMALIGIVRLWDDAALVELDGVAVLP